MPNTQIFPSALVAILTLLPSPVLSQARTVDVRASVGYTYRLDDSPLYGWLGGGTVTVPRGVHSRFGVEGWYVSMFGPYGHQEKAEARLVTALWEYAFFPGQRVNPYAVIGVGVTQYRSWYLDFGPIPGSPGWDIQHGLHVLGGLGVRLFLTPHVFIAPEVRIGLVPLFRSTVALGYAF